MNSKDIIDEVVEIPQEGEEEAQSNVKISTDVVATIAAIATGDVKGVAGMSSSLVNGIAEIFSAKKNLSKGVKVDIKENTVVIDLYIAVDYGMRIPEIAWEVQENVKNDVETMTGLVVEKVNIHVEGVSFEKAKNEEKAELQQEDEQDEVIVAETVIEELKEEE